MEKLYIVTRGEYSAYRILGCFDNQLQADRFKGALGNEATVETWARNPTFIEMAPGEAFYEVVMGRDGQTYRCSPKWFTGSGPSNDDFHTTLGGPYSHDEKRRLYVSLIAKSKEHATKIVNEKRTHLIASGMWPEE